jgi:hypothetical protein
LASTSQKPTNFTAACDAHVVQIGEAHAVHADAGHLQLAVEVLATHEALERRRRQRRVTRLRGRIGVWLSWMQKPTLREASALRLSRNSMAGTANA